MYKNPSQETELTHKRQRNSCQSLESKSMKKHFNRNHGKKLDNQEFSYFHQIHVQKGFTQGFKDNYDVN